MNFLLITIFIIWLSLWETESLNIIRKTGFMLDAQNLRFILADDEYIYNFIHDEIEDYMNKLNIYY